MKILLILHVCASIVLLGSATHNGIYTWRYTRGYYRNCDLQKRYVSVLFYSYIVTFLLGLIIYPAFRVGVRPDFLDVLYPLATGFFEAKEHLMALGMGLLLWYYPMSRKIELHHPGALHTLYHFCGLVLMGVVWFGALTGLTLVSLKAL